MLDSIFLAVLLALFPRSTITANLRVDATVLRHVVASAARHDVPPVGLLAVGFMESGLDMHQRHTNAFGVTPAALVWACAQRAGWRPLGRGTPARCGTDPVQRQAEAAAIVLRRSLDVCGSWVGAVRRFNTGRCGYNPRRASYVANVADLVRRMRYQARRLHLELPVPATMLAAR